MKFEREEVRPRQTDDTGEPGGVILLVRSRHGWRADVRAALSSESTHRIAREARTLGEALETVTKVQVDAIVVDAEAADGSVVAFLEAMRRISPGTPIVMVGDEGDLDPDALLALVNLGLSAYVLWPSVTREAVPHWFRTAVDDHLLVASRPVVQRLLAGLERRRGPRVEALLLTAAERAAVRERTERLEGEVEATLWAENPELAAFLQLAFGLAEVGLDIVWSEEALLTAAMRARPGDFLLIDCSQALPGDVARCAAIVRQVALPVHIIHPRQDAVAALRQVARCELAWAAPEAVGLGLVDKLRVLKAAAPIVAEQDTYERLTIKERNVLRLVGEGKTNKEIAHKLNRAESTIKNYVARLKIKTGRSSRAEVMAYHHEMRERRDR